MTAPPPALHEIKCFITDLDNNNSVNPRRGEFAVRIRPNGRDFKVGDFVKIQGDYVFIITMIPEEYVLSGSTNEFMTLGLYMTYDPANERFSSIKE